MCLFLFALYFSACNVPQIQNANISTRQYFVGEGAYVRYTCANDFFNEDTLERIFLTKCEYNGELFPAPSSCSRS